MKKGFEEAFAPLSGFQFADQQSRENALWALYWSKARHAPERKPMVIITGPPMSGKSELARRLTFAHHPVSDALTEKDLAAVLGHAVERGGRSVVFDMISARVINAPTLCRFLSSRRWVCRIAGTNQTSEGESSQLLIATCHEDVKISEDLKRRAVMIRLLALSPESEPDLTVQDAVDVVIRGMARVKPGTYSLRDLITGMGGDVRTCADARVYDRALARLEIPVPGGRDSIVGTRVVVTRVRKSTGWLFEVTRAGAKQGCRKVAARANRKSASSGRRAHF